MDHGGKILVALKPEVQMEAKSSPPYYNVKGAVDVDKATEEQLETIKFALDMLGQVLRSFGLY